MKSDRDSALLIVGIIVLLLLVVIFIIIGQKNSESRNFRLGDYASTIAAVRLASANNALNGSGDLTENQCEKLGELAKKFNNSTDYIKCSSPKRIYLSTPDTSEKYVLTLSDDKYTATFTTDSEVDFLLDYSFEAETSSGFNSYEGRK